MLVAIIKSSKRNKKIILDNLYELEGVPITDIDFIIQITKFTFQDLLLQIKKDNKIIYAV